MELATLRRLVVFTLIASAVFLSQFRRCSAQFDKLPNERWAKLREVERYQLNIAEKYYKANNWKVAVSEYDKYLKLYEDSEAAPYALLKWSRCQVKLRKGHTAIKEGYQSVIDYWPDSPEAPAAAYYMAKTSNDIGQIRSSKKFYKQVIDKYGKHLVASHAMSDLIALAVVEKDEKTQLDLRKKLTFDVHRSQHNGSICNTAAAELATYYFNRVAFEDGVKARATVTYGREFSAATGQQRIDGTVASVKASINKLLANTKTKAQGDRLAGLAIAYVRKQTPTGTTEEDKILARLHWLHVADLTITARQKDKVPGVYEQMLKIFGSDDEVLTRLAAWYITEKRYDEARAAYRRFTDKVKGLEYVAITYRISHQKKLASAIDAYNQILGLDPDRKVHWKQQVALTYNEFGNYLQAIGVYAELQNLDIENRHKWKGNIASTYSVAKKYNEAIAVYKQLIQEDIGGASNWSYQVAWIHHHRTGKLTDAISYYRQCINTANKYNQIADCYLRLKQYPRAIQQYKTIIGDKTLTASAPQAQLNIAWTQEKAGKKESAIKAFQTVCKNYPKLKQASQAHAHLQSKYKINVTLGGSKDE